jgi:thioredoxin
MKTFVRSNAELSEFMGNNPLLVVYFYSDTCNTCMALRPKIEALMDEFPKAPLFFVDSEKNPKINGKFGVFTNPTMIVFIEGKENKRFGRYLSVNELRESLQRPYQLIFE